MNKIIEYESAYVPVINEARARVIALNGPSMQRGYNLFPPKVEIIKKATKDDNMMKMNGRNGNSTSILVPMASFAEAEEEEEEEDIF